MHDRYTSFAHLADREILGRDYRITLLDRPASPVIVLAPHGGTIEIGTSELAGLIAGDEHSLFSFEGLKPYGRNRELHITSHLFDHPQCLELTGSRDVIVAIHGCIGESHVYIGGLDSELKSLLGERLLAAGVATSLSGHRYPGRNPLNICNRGRRARGVQIELTNDLRRVEGRAIIGPAVRSAIGDYVASMGPPTT